MIKKELIANAIEIVEAIHEPLLVLDSRLCVIYANQSFYRGFNVSPPDTEGRVIFTLGNGQWDIPGLRRLLTSILPEKKEFNAYEVHHVFKDIGDKYMLLNAREIIRHDNRQKMILLAIEDITQRRLLEESLKNVHGSIGTTLERLVDSAERYNSNR